MLEERPGNLEVQVLRAGAETSPFKGVILVRALLHVQLGDGLQHRRHSTSQFVPMK